MPRVPSNIQKVIQPILDWFQNVYEKIKQIFIEVWSNLKKILEKDMLIIQKKKKGKSMETLRGL